MTKQEITESLIAGSQNHNAEFVTVKRDHLLIALGAANLPEETKGNDGKEIADVQGSEGSGMDD